MSYCVQFGADVGCLIVCISVLTMDDSCAQFCVDVGCLVVRSSAMTTDVLLCAVRC